jgi:hypothetical protein
MQPTFNLLCGAFGFGSGKKNTMSRERKRPPPIGTTHAHLETPKPPQQQQQLLNVTVTASTNEIGSWLSAIVVTPAPQLIGAMRQALVAFSEEGWHTVDDLLASSVSLVSISILAY